jgi:MtN3 and saliva related transmembrane protein
MEIDGILLTILGTLAGIFILSGWVEQIITGYKTKSLKDVSKYLMILISVGAGLWLIYGFIVEDVFIIGTNLTAIALMMAVLIMKRRYDQIRQFSD